MMAFGDSMGALVNANLTELLDRLKIREADYPFGNLRTVLDEDSNALEQLGMQRR